MLSVEERKIGKSGEKSNGVGSISIVISGEVDPRLEAVRKRLMEISEIIVVLSGKGGVGKSLIASSLALILGSEWRVGLLDLDFEAPSAHVILGIGEDVSPKEDKGCLLYTSPSPRDRTRSRMPSSA